ncbi:SAM-dependent methyltransferase [Streptomyces radicis]|uniref:Class I SAM-dependent methyltransferase n=1 Tax=Streptomyces radicis TaxID=1750517 RepID=A0A3A9VXI7_9ACTN|nr:class I SAM-dependent methyltransferase [Streptomyces radicis]RKN05222.1 class I SAM-dependent methyltransferase [Streptomyces radicis]RKN16755.1 class I SAM-dependent methyltransferase [Streptomyces radicis]
MERYDRHLITHSEHPIAAPLSGDAFRAVLAVAMQRPSGGGRLFDLGCGQAQWLLTALTGWSRATGVGVDISEPCLDRAAAQARRLGVADRLELHEADAARFAAITPPGTFDVVLCVGSTHAFGGLLPALAAARRLLAPGGCVVVGEGFWEREPGPAALRALDARPDDHADLGGTVDRVVADGWLPVNGHTSTLDEWDEYEWCWTGSLSRWALDHPDHPDAAEARATADAHRTGWLHGYRGTLGFVTLVLRDAA